MCWNIYLVCTSLELWNWNQALTVQSDCRTLCSTCIMASLYPGKIIQENQYWGIRYTLLLVRPVVNWLAYHITASHQCGPGVIPAWCLMRVEFVVGSYLTLRFSSFPPSTKKTTSLKSNSARIEDLYENQLRLAYSLNTVNLVNLFLFLFEPLQNKK